MAAESNVTTDHETIRSRAEKLDEAKLDFVNEYETKDDSASRFSTLVSRDVDPEDEGEDDDEDDEDLLDEDEDDSEE